MAIAKYGAIITDIKGKVGGTVFKGTKAGASVQNKTRKASNASRSGKLSKADAGRTIANQVNLALIATRWRALSDSDRAAWAAAAPDFPFINRFGESYTGSGYQLYMQCNINLFNIGESAIDVPPSPDPIADTPPFTITPPATPADPLAFNSSNTAGYSQILYATGNISTGRAAQPGMYKAIAILDGATVFPYDVKADYVRVFGSLPPSGNVWFSSKLSKADAGRQALPYTVQVTL